MVPDADTRFSLAAQDGAPALDFVLGDITALDGTMWDFCTRSLAKRALAELHEVAGVNILSAFEHEFQLTDLPACAGDSYGFNGYRQAQGWAEALTDAMAETGCVPDTFMKEYGRHNLR